MKITLLTHEKELSRKHNTGQLCFELPNVSIQRSIWQRKSPDNQLVNALNNHEAVLLTPNGGGSRLTKLSQDCHIVLLDGTWQEAKKMVNRSAYLKSADWFSLALDEPSKFHLRRNQIEGGLCTAECVIQLLKLSGNNSARQQLQQRFEQFLGQN